MTRNNLLPTVITDKNGKVTTVHKKQDESKSSRAILPAPTLNKEKSLSKAARVRGIIDLFESEPGSGLVKAQVQRFVASSTPEQLQVLDEALRSYGSCSHYEKAIIRGAFVSLSSNLHADDTTTYDQLSLRSAFLSEKSREEGLFKAPSFLNEYIFGVRFTRTDAYHTPLDQPDEKTRQENIALLRFAFELQQRAPYGGFLPTYRIKISRESYQYAKAYESHDLTDLIIEYPDRVEEMIEAAITNQTCNGQRLRAILEHEGHSSLTSGAL